MKSGNILILFLLSTYHLMSQSLLDSFNTSVYIWSKDFRAISNSELSALLIKHKVQQAFISDDEDSLLKHKKQLLCRGLKNTNIRVVHLIGYNQWLRLSDRNLQKCINRLPHGRFHIDIEPHTMPDWPENKIYYQHKYLKILNLLHAKGEVTAAIPFHFNQDFIKEIYKKTSLCYIMVYGKANMEAWHSRLADELRVSRGQMSFCFNVNDYSSSSEMEYTINKFRNQYNCTTIAIHAFMDWAKLQ